MTRTRYGMIAGLAGVAMALANWWWRRPDYVARQMSLAGRDELSGQTGGRTGETHPSAVV